MQETSFIDKWNQAYKQGFKQGLLQGMIDLVLRMLKRKFSHLDLLIEQQIQTLPLERVRKLGEDLIDFKTEKDLTNWLKENRPDTE